MVDNYDWFKDINYLEFLRDIGTCYSVNRMLTMDSVKVVLNVNSLCLFLNLTICFFRGMIFVFCCKNTAAVPRLPELTNGETSFRAQNSDGAVMIRNCLGLPVRLLRIRRVKNGKIGGECRLDK